MRTPSLLSLAHSAALLLLLPAGVAQAAPGDHIGNDTAQLIPALELGVRHRTNAYLQEGVAGGGEPVTGGTALLINPSLGIRAKNSDLRFMLDFEYTAKKYLQSDLTNLDRFNIFGLNTGLQLFPEGIVGLRLSDNFSITGYEAEDQAGVTDSAYQQHLLNRLGAFVTVRPGGPLEVDAGGRLNVDQWNVPEEFKSQETGDSLELTSSLTGPGLNSRIGYGPALEAKWRFFPKTAVVGDFDYEWFKWKDNIVDAQGDGISSEEIGDYLAIPDGRQWHARAGLRGRVTDKLVIGAMLGFGQALYLEDSVTTQADEFGLGGSEEFSDSVGFGADLKAFPNGLVAEVEADYEFVSGHHLIASYKRDFQDTYFSNFVGFDRGILEYNSRIAEVVGIQALGMYRLERYLGEVSRDDHLVKANLTGTWYAQDYLSVSLGGGWARRVSADGNHPEIEYDDVRIEGSATFTY